MEKKLSLLTLVLFVAITLAPLCFAGDDIKKNASTGDLAGLLLTHAAKQDPDAQSKKIDAKLATNQTPQPKCPEDAAQKVEFLKAFCFSTGDLLSFAAMSEFGE